MIPAYDRIFCLLGLALWEWNAAANQTVVANATYILDLYFETKYSLKYRRRGHIYCLDRLEIRISCLLRVHLHSLHRYSCCHNMHRIWHLQILCFRKPDSISIGEKCDKIHINSLHPWRSLKIQLQSSDLKDYNLRK